MTAFEQIPIENVIPQRPPFVFVDKLLHYDEQVTRTCYTVPEAGIFVENGRFQTAGLVEHMAQSSAARVGYIARYIQHVPVSIGFIGNVRKLKIYRHPAAGERLETEVVLLQDFFGITLTSVEVCSGGETVATALLKTALSDKTMTE